MPYKDECGLCKRVLSTRYLRKCERCGRLYCRDCMIPDVVTGDPRRLYCLNCARRTVAPSTVSRYNGLTKYLQFRGAFTSIVTLTFARIDGIIGENLPMAAYKSEQWWSNLPSGPNTHGWLDAGWEVQGVDLKKGSVTFKKVKVVAPLRKSSVSQIKKPFTPVRVRMPKPKMPSKTKVSKLYARIKNIERQRQTMPSFHGSFKPRPKYQKQLYKPDEKPS
jgi:hypothetical protein